MDKTRDVLGLTVALGAGLWMSTASAVTFDFKDPNIDRPATNNDFYWDDKGGSGETSGDIDTSGLWIEASASGGDNALYLDNITRPNVGLGNDDDNGGSDEEVEDGESITLKSNVKVTLDELEFWNPGHGADFETGVFFDLYVVLGTGPEVLVLNDFQVANMIDLSPLNIMGTSFRFEADLGAGIPADRGWYMGAAAMTAVPEPASLALLGMGLLGAGASRRRRR